MFNKLNIECHYLQQPFNYPPHRCCIWALWSPADDLHAHREPSRPTWPSSAELFALRVKSKSDFFMYFIFGPFASQEPFFFVGRYCSLPKLAADWTYICCTVCPWKAGSAAYSATCSACDWLFPQRPHSSRRCPALKPVTVSFSPGS